MGPDLDTLSLAVGAGLVAALNPCGFALLPVYLSLFVLDERPARSVAVRRAILASAAMTLGFAAVFAVFGLAVAPVAASVQRFLPGVTVVLGLLVAASGGWLLAGRRLPGLRIGRRGGTGAGRPVTADAATMAGFGASYAIASLGCTIAPFLAVVVTAFRAGSVGDGLVLFLAYSAGMGLVVGTAAVAVALAREGLLGRLRRAGAFLTRASGLLLLVAGGYVAWYGAWELRVLHAGAGADPAVDAAATVQRWLADAARGIGADGFLVLLAVLVAAGLWWRGHRRGAAQAAAGLARRTKRAKRSPTSSP